MSVVVNQQCPDSRSSAFMISIANANSDTLDLSWSPVLSAASVKSLFCAYARRLSHAGNLAALIAFDDCGCQTTAWQLRG